MINTRKIETAILSRITFNRIIDKLKRKYYIDLQDKFPVGYDKQSLSAFIRQRDLNINIIIDKLKKGEYKFSPFIERKVPETHKKALTLCQGCLCDVIVQMVFNKVITKSIQSYFSNGLFSGRVRGMRINIHSLINRVYKFHKDEKNYALKLDIENYYNEIDKKLLEKQIKKLFGQNTFIFKTIKSYIYSKVCIKGEIVENKKGIHIGSNLANILANIYLTDFDKYFRKKVIFYARYADDIFIICDSLKDAKNILVTVKKKLQRYSLRINREKLKIIKPGENFAYLGFEFREGKIYIREKSIIKFKNKVKRYLRKSKYQELSKLKNQDYILHNCHARKMFLSLINDINQLICGNFYRNWIRYFSKVSFSVQFRELDLWIKNKFRQKLTGKWSSKNYKKFTNDFFHQYGLKSMVREYYKYNEKWKLYSKPLLSRIVSIENLEKAADYYLDRNKRSSDHDVVEFMSNRRKILEEVQEKLLNLSYKFSKPRKKEIRRRDTKELRSIYTVNLKDRTVQRAIINIIPAYYDGELSEDVYSYRKGTSVFKAVSKIIRVLRNSENRRVYKSDFENFNESIDLEILKDKLGILFSKEQNILELFCALLDSLKDIGYLPKGMPLTNFLLNIYLIDFDTKMAQEFDFYIRYADDFLITVPKDYTLKKVNNIVQKEASRLHLKRKKEKTKIVDKGDFGFLGYKFTIGRKLRIGLSNRAVLMIKRKIKRITQKRKYPYLTIRNYKNSQDLKNVINKINYYFSSKKRMGLCKYFCRTNDFEQLKLLDIWIRDRIRLAIIKRMNLKNRRLILNNDLKELGLISLVSWICLAKGLMYNKLTAYQYYKV